MKKSVIVMLSCCLFFSFSLSGILAQSMRDLSPLEERIRYSLVTLPFYSLFDILRFQIEGDTVTLSGQVTQASLKDSAEAVVKRVSDVQNVKNEIEILPLSPNDDRIRLDAYRAIYYNPNFIRYALRAVPPIHIIVKNGDLILEGVVATESDKTLANIRAQSLPGVFSVTNNLVVERD